MTHRFRGAGTKRGVYGATNDAWISNLRIANDAGLVNVFPREADVGCGRWPNIVLVWNDVGPDRALGYFAALLRRVVFISELTLSLGFDVERVGLSAMTRLERSIRASGEGLF